jgi:amino acid permease
MISLGGTIGTGLFLASGASIASAGPGGALIAYALIGVMVYFMMECLGEMVRYYIYIDVASFIHLFFLFRQRTCLFLEVLT